MEENIEEKKALPKEKHIALLVLATIAVIVVAFSVVLIWSINFRELGESAPEGGDHLGTTIEVFFSLLLVSIPFLGASLLAVVVSAVFAPLSFAILAKSSLKPISIIGVVYGLALSVAIAATIVRAVFFFTGQF